jgi:methylenetetrahydrofolate dehydrogenase (NADP+)/methenyltetrahydrofolate cyclohydrolase
MQEKIASGKATLVDGALIAASIKEEVAREVRRLKDDFGVQPGLAVVRVGEDPASAVYVGSKVRTSQELGMLSEHHALAEEVRRDELLGIVDRLNLDERIDGILVQLPLPNHIEEESVLEAIDPAKDVDGFHPFNVGRLALGQPTLVPCTPLGVIEMLSRCGVSLRGKHACVVGRSNIVGKPMAQLFLQRDATVTICHSKTPDLAAITSEADILVAAVGRVGLITGEHIKPGAVVIDVGMNKVSDPALAAKLFSDDLEKRLDVIARRGATLVGDVNPSEALLKASLFTPVPGGVGLLTVAMLMKNTVEAAKRRRGIMAL